MLIEDVPTPVFQLNLPLVRDVLVKFNHRSSLLFLRHFNAASDIRQLLGQLLLLDVNLLSADFH